MLIFNSLLKMENLDYTVVIVNPCNIYTLPVAIERIVLLWKSDHERPLPSLLIDLRLNSALLWPLEPPVKAKRQLSSHYFFNGACPHLDPGRGGGTSLQPVTRHLRYTFYTFYGQFRVFNESNILVRKE